MLKWPYFSSNARKHFIVPLPFLLLGKHPPPAYRPPLGLGFEYSNFATQQNPQLPNQPPPNYSSLQNPGVSNQYPPLGGQPSSSTMIWSSNVVSFTYYITVVWKRHSHWRRNKLQSGGGGGLTDKHYTAILILVLHVMCPFTCDCCRLCQVAPAPMSMNEPPPQDYTKRALFATLCCCFPIGLCALMNANAVRTCIYTHDCKYGT